MGEPLTPHQSHEPDSAGLWIATVAILGQLMVILDVAVVVVATPTIRASLGFSLPGVQWVASVYTLTFAGLLMIGGRAADLYGRRRVFIAGLAVFTAASAVGGLAPNPAVLVAARALQGCGAAVLSPATLTIIVTDLQGRQRSRAVGTWASMSGVGGGLGVFLGGLLTQTLSWRWILFINVPIGVMILVVARMVLRRDDSPPATCRLDIAGAVTVTFGMVSLVFGIARVGVAGWKSPAALTAFAVAAVALATFWQIESRWARHPIVPLPVLRDRALVGVTVVILLLYTVVIAPWFLLSFYMQVVLGWRPLQAGAGLLPQAAVIAASAQAGSWLARWRGAVLLVIIGPILASAGLLVMWWETRHVGPAGYVAAVLVPLILLGLAIGLTLSAATLIATESARHEDTGLVSGLLNTSRQFGGALGLALLYTAGTARAQDVSPVTGVSNLVVPVPPGYATAALTGAVIAVVAAAVAVVAVRTSRRPPIGRTSGEAGE
jgi:EmrB/QacA subfamily drug resistance transporter